MKQDKGFTLIELITTTAVLAILVALSVTSYTAYIGTARLNSAAREFKANVELAKIQAIKRRAPVCLGVTFGVGASGRYIIYVDNGSMIKTYETGEESILTNTMPNKINLVSSTVPGNAFRFTPVGIPDDSTGSIIIRNSDSTKFRRITVGSAGTIKLELSTDGTNWRE